MNKTPSFQDSFNDSAPLLKAVALCKSFHIGTRRLEILRDISLEIKRGEFIALQGASGAGKSTLLNLLAGLDLPDNGFVQIDGIRTDKISNSELSDIRNLKIGFIFQSYHLLPDFDALENVSIPARIARRPAFETRRRAIQLLEQVGLKDRMTHRPSELSGGEQQRVAIARALINNPPLIIADEPTGNLDSLTGGEILELLLRLCHQEQSTLLMATHDTLIANRADRSLHIADGKLDESPLCPSK